ncbi:hypothetical protein IFM89_000544 [Coptis chinensis]|uniref:Transposase MuDR plant domain-containing protein n=1 Tax=Coptis chinensis TaxID=261450 RepID=A0A835H0V9_9MAGN|nr:hypothetical protein IFM89_000544 [Coptis chinensis]
MGDRKNLKIHYAGSFSKRRNGEELSHLHYRSKYPVKEMLDVDSDELNMIDFSVDVSLPSHMSKLDYMNIKLFYLVSGKEVYVNSDSGLLRMFDLLVVDDEGYCHVFVENDIGESDVPPSQEYDETMCTLMDLKKLIKKRDLNANDKGNSMQKKKKSFNDKRFGSKENKKSGKDKGEAKGKKISTTHMKGKGVLVDEEDSFWDELSTFNKFSDEEMDTELPDTNSSDEEIEWQQPRSDEFYNFVYETSNVYVDEGEIVMPTCSDEWKVGMEWPDIETLRHEISDYCIKNRFEVDMRTVNERCMIRAKCKGSYQGKDCPWVAYWRLRPDAFTMRLNTFVNEHICYVDPELKNGMADANWVARKIAPQMKVSTYKLAYMGHIMPMPDMSEWPMNCDLERQIMPPPYVRGIERPKKARTRGADEEVNPNKQIRLCSKCKQPGHNAKTYKEEALESTQASQASSPTQASSSRAAKRVCSKCNHLGHNAKTCKGLPTAKKGKHGKKSQEETQASQASAPVPDEAKKSTQASQVSAPVPEEALESTQSASSKAAHRAPEQSHIFGDFLSKQSSKSSTSVLEAAELTFTAGGTVKAPIATKRPRLHGPGSTPFMPVGPAS